jgi:chromosomal replication initiator protein
MVQALIDIPLPGLMLGSPGDQKKAPKASNAPSHFLAGPENRLVQVVVRSVLGDCPDFCVNKNGTGYPLGAFGLGYNPIVLYGPSGTGKSHLALGLAAEWKSRHRRRVECVAAVDFARELAEAIETQALEEFRTKYRQADLLVFEDIGRLINRASEKLSAQGEFVHTLDELIDRGSWVIVTSMTAPYAMTGMLPALQSRLTAGLTVPLAPPESDTRLAIIKSLADMRKIDLSGPVARTLADGLCGTVPELMGALTQLEVPAHRDGSRISVKEVQSLLARRGSQCKTSTHAIALATARHFGLKLSELRSPSRQRAVVAARDVAVYLTRNVVKCSFDEIGRYFGGRDHTTMMHSWHKIETLLHTDSALQHELLEIEGEINKTKG